MGKKLLVYVAAPYSAPTGKLIWENVQHAFDVALTVYKLGYIPYVPHVTHFFDLHAESNIGTRLPWQLYMDWHRPALVMCSAFLLCTGWENSIGCNQELDYAAANSIPIYLEEELCHQ